MLTAIDQGRGLMEEQARELDFEKPRFLSHWNDSVELVVVTHVVDAITFWAQDVTEDKAAEKMDTILSEKCPAAPRLAGRPSPQKFYGACYSEDRCWYRCKVQQQVDDKFHVSYVDYGNAEVVGRSDLVELPEDLQSAALAKKYKFWGFHLSSEQDSPHYSQGKSFLQNLIYGKKLRINKKSVCFDGTILVQAFQGNHDIGEEVLKFKFAKVSLPGNREGPFPAKALQKSTGLWPSVGSQGDSDNPGSLECMPKLRPAFSSLKPPGLIEHSTSTTLVTANVPQTEKELVNENRPPNAEMVIQQLCSQVTEQMLNEARSELQLVRQEMEEKTKEIEKLEEEKSAIQKHAEHLEHQLEEARLKLQKVTEVCQREEKSVEVHLDTAVGGRFSQLAQKMEAVRKQRESNPCSTAGDRLLESITIVVNNRIIMPFTSEKLEVAWDVHRQTLKKLRDCQSKGGLEDLVKSRNQACSVLLTAINDFLLEVDSLPISERLESLKGVSSSLKAVLTVDGDDSVSEDVEDQTFEKFCAWRNQKHQNSRNVQHATDKALCALRDWAANTSKFLCLTEKAAVTLEAVADEVDDILKQAETSVCVELNINLSEQGVQEMKMMSNAFHKVMQHIQKEQHLLCDIREKYEANKKFKQEMLQWQTNTPKADELLCIKKRIRSLRSQLRWKLVEVGCLEEADDLDLPEILKKKEEIAETRNALFQEIRHEKEEYTKLCELVKGNFPELVQLYPEAEFNSYLSSEGLLMQSLDRDIFDAEPMRELSGRRPLVCTEFQGQKVVLKGYSVDEESEVRMLQQAAQYHRVQSQSPSTVMPLLGLFFGKSDPLAYIVVPYFSVGSLRALQKNNPLTHSDIQEVMRGVLVGLQSLHVAGIIHASLNPNNVFVLNRERGIVGDYDFTKTPEQRAVDIGMAAGSVSLVAPELRRGQPPSPASDMYAFGGLVLWLYAPNFRAVENEQLSLEFTELQLDDKLQSLLSKLLVFAGRLSALEALNEDYFVSVEN